MTKTEKKRLDKLDATISEALDTLCEGCERAVCEADNTGVEAEVKLPTQELKKVAKKLEKALIKCEQLLVG